MPGLWRKINSDAREQKYLVQRRDGTVPAWPWFVLGARDLAAPTALRAYADAAEGLKFDPQYVADVRALANDFEEYLAQNGMGNPDASPHRTDDPAIVALMATGKSA